MFEFDLEFGVGVSNVNLDLHVKVVFWYVLERQNVQASISGCELVT